MSLFFKLLHKDSTSNARNTEILTKHGLIKTPVFMSVGTFGAVRTLNHEELENCGTQIILGNTYHLYLRPHIDILQKTKGYHNFISWQKPILTDSGGFQIFSLPHRRIIFEKGVFFRSYIDNSEQFFSPESNIAFQEIIGSDIMMVLDVCVPSTSSYQIALEAMERTHRWAIRALNAKKNSDNSLFGIVQGAIYEDLRLASANYLSNLNFDGYAIGGLAVGETEQERDYFMKFTVKHLPENKPRYLMGVGTPYDIVKAVGAGIDMFDCIIPTNHARQGVCYTFEAKIQLRRNIYATDFSPLSNSCDCYVCKRYSKAYLHQLLKSEEPTGWKLCAYHNTWFYERLMERIRIEIDKNNYENFANDFLKTGDKHE